MRLLKIGVYHPTYIHQFYTQRPRLAAQSFDVQQSALLDDCFGSSDFWTCALSELGYQTGEVIANVEPMQKRWAIENGVGYDEADWLFDIAIAQVKAFQPEVLIVADYSTFTAQALRRLKEQCPSVRLLLGWCGAPYADASVFREWDIVLSCVPELVRHFLEEGHRAYHINHAFAPRILGRLAAAVEPTVDFTFIGSVFKRDQFHLKREKILLDLIEHTNLQIWSDVAPLTAQRRRSIAMRRWAYDALHAARHLGVPQTLLNSAPIVQKVARWETRPDEAESVDARIAGRARPPLFGIAMYQQLRDSRVALNTHIDISSDSASNMRLFEAMGVGSCLLTDWKANLPELFEPDAEVLTYQNTEECLEKVKYILTHEAERRAIAAAGQRRILREHTFAQRAAQIDGIIREALLKR